MKCNLILTESELNSGFPLNLSFPDLCYKRVSITILFHSVV